MTGEDGRQGHRRTMPGNIPPRIPRRAALVGLAAVLASAGGLQAAGLFSARPAAVDGSVLAAQGPGVGGAAAPVPAAAGTPAPVDADPLSIFREAVRHRDSRPVVVVAAGSSTTAGANATTPEASYVHLLARFLQAAYPLSDGAPSPATVRDGSITPPVSRPGIRMVNFGVSGTRAETYLSAGDRRKIADLQTSMVLHMVGANDYAGGTTPAAYRAHLGAQLEALRAAASAPCAHVLIQSYTRRDRAAARGHVAPAAAFGRVMRDLAAASPQDTVFVDLSAEYADVGVPGPDPFDLLDTDEVHQTDAGHAFMAEALRRRLGIPRVRQTAAV
jgi:lysophospholipase L1-like esterase